MFDRFRKLLSRTPEEAPAPPEHEEAVPSGPLRATDLEILGFDEILIFRSHAVLPVLEDFETELPLGEGGSEILGLRNRTRVERADHYEYTAEVTASPAALAALEERYGPRAQARGDRPERRALPRVPHRIRIRSRHLPHFQALTHDMTLQGLRLLSEGEVAPGTELDLDMQLDHDRLPNVKGRAVAVWTAPLEGRTWWVGARITGLEDPATLEEYLGEVGGATDDGLTRKNFLE